MLDAMRQKCQDYYDQIPADTLPVIAKSALFSFSISLILIDRTKPYDLTQPLIKGGIAALAACIYSLTAPFFNGAFGDNRHLYHRELLKMFVIVSLTTVIYNSLTIGKVSITALPMLTILSWNVIIASFDAAPAIIDHMDPAAAQEIRKVYTFLGINSVPGSGSIQLVF